jgi:hypothetical protein
MTPVADTATRAAVRSAALDRFTRLIVGASRLWDYSLPLEYDDQDRAVLGVSAALDVADEQVALVEETYLEPVLW